jgi:phosphoribosyl 1,2-cyclic phosphate phosphodiesterase
VLPSAKLIFLGTGAAWRLPELGCDCAICKQMRILGERRGRTSLWFDGPARLLIDCGPDAAWQLDSHGLGRPDGVVITHEHGDHYIGLDELDAFRRVHPENGFTPIPCYAHPDAWTTIEARFGYLLGRVISRNDANPGHTVEGLESFGVNVIPFKTDHGPIPKGSMGYAIQYNTDDGPRTLVYTSDFKDVTGSIDALNAPDYLVASCHWFNEPEHNRPSHMSFQRLLDFIKQWQPKRHVYLVHISDGDVAEGDFAESMLKKRKPLDPLPYPVPIGQAEWQSTVEKVFQDHGITVPVTVPWDGLTVQI